MSWYKPSDVGFAVRSKLADVGLGARLFLRLAFRGAQSLRRFGLVRDQIHFLGNYIELLGKQSGTGAVFELNTYGQYDKLKIAPLLLVGFIDKIAGDNNANGRKKYFLDLEFAGTEMEFRVKGAFSNEASAFFTNGDSLFIRLKELYPDKYSFHYIPGNDQLSLNVKLDEQD